MIHKAYKRHIIQGKWMLHASKLWMIDISTNYGTKWNDIIIKVSKNAKKLKILHQRQHHGYKEIVFFALIRKKDPDQTNLSKTLPSIHCQNIHKYLRKTPWHKWSEKQKQMILSVLQPIHSPRKWCCWMQQCSWWTN